MMPVMYMFAMNRKHSRFDFGSLRRKSLAENLEFYPVARRAFNRALGNYFYIVVSKLNREEQIRNLSVEKAIK